MKRPSIPNDPALPPAADIALLRAQPINVLRACVCANANGHVVCVRGSDSRDYLVRPDYPEEAIYSLPYGEA